MNCILDTSTLIWTLMEPNKLSKSARKIISDPAVIKHISAVSFLEMSIKMSIGKLELTGIDIDELPTILYDNGAKLIVLDPLDSIALNSLPLKNDHRDPFDRIIITQAIQHNLTLISSDEKIKQYRDDGLSLIW